MADGNSTFNIPEWRQRKDGDSFLQSAIEMTRAIVENRKFFVDSHYRQMLKICVWKFTEAEGSGKYNTRYRSVGAILNPDAKLNHEHVITSKSICDAIIANPDNFKMILSTAVGCTVLKTENDLLTLQDKSRPGLIGWDRYRELGIEVWDLKEKRRVV